MNYKGAAMNTIKKMATERNDGYTITSILHAISNLDNCMARNLIKHPDTILNLMDNAHNLQCPYAMHAITISLTSDNCQDILKEMSDADIATLHKCILLAKKRQQIAPSVIQEHIIRQEKNASSQNPTKQRDGKHMLNSLNISAMINNKSLWNDCVQELNKWDNAIKTFKRTQNTTKIQAIATAQHQPEFLTITQIANKLGVNRYDIANHIKPYLDKKKDGPISNWFTVHNGKISLMADHFSDYKDQFESRKSRAKTNANSKNKTTSKKTEHKTIQIIPQKSHMPKNLLDIQALKTYINTLITLLEESKEEHEIHQDKSQKLRTTIASEQDAVKISKLLQDISSANEQVIQSQAKIDSLSKRFACANQLLTNYNNAVKQLHETNKAISTFIESEQQNID